MYTIKIYYSGRNGQINWTKSAIAAPTAVTTSTSTVTAELCHVSIYLLQLQLRVLGWIWGEWRDETEFLKCEWSGGEYDSCV